MKPQRLKASVQNGDNADGDSGLDYLVFLTIWYVPIVVTTHIETICALSFKGQK